MEWVKVGTAIGYTIGAIFGLILAGYLVYVFSRLQMKAWKDEFFKYLKEDDKKEKNQFQK